MVPRRPRGLSSADARDPDVHPIDLRPHEDIGRGFVGSPAPRLSWRLAATRPNVRQLGYEIAVALDEDFGAIVATSGPVPAAAPIGAAWPGFPLRSRQVRWARVRVWTEAGLTAWSAPVRLEAALLSQDDWLARPISPLSNVDQAQPAPVPLLRRAFVIDRPVAAARLYVTAQGVHETWLNGERVGDGVLEPGWTAYQSRLGYGVHDVADQLKLGENVLSAAVGDGWWRGWLTWMGRRAIYGATTALLAQLEITYQDGASLVVASDASWRGATGALRKADLYDGVECDLRQEPVGWRGPGFDDRDWEAVAVLDLPPGLHPYPTPPARIVETRLIEPAGTHDEVLRIDTAQNLTGHLRLTVRGARGAAITVRHAEMLDDRGGLYTAPLRRAKATDRYVLADDQITTLEPAFTFHGFRYAEIQADPGVEVLRVEARVLTSDLPQTGTFVCSDERLNRLFQNVRWSQLGNFIWLPTDCPQRDERLGWTGDIQVFAQTACANADCRTFLENWLIDLEIEQRHDGNVPSTAPNVLDGFEYEYGGVGWGDAAVLTPWALYEAFGDVAALAQRFDSMRAWVDYGASRRDRDGAWSGDFQLGDWLDPGAPPGSPEKATTDGGFIATAYLAHSARTVSRAAGVLGRREHQARYEALAAKAAAAAWSRWGDHAMTTQTGCAMALQFGVAPPAQTQAVVRALVNLVEANDGRIATGFLGTPLVLPALAEGGQVEAAYRLLLNVQCPGWLYQVARGATTMWERWDAVQEDGSLHGGAMAIAEGASMISFNHYAYGAVAAWLYRGVAGIAPDVDAPGYRRIRFAPKPGGGLQFARAEIDTPFGPAAIGWRLTGDQLAVSLTIPPGAQGVFEPPAGWAPPDGGALGPDLGSGQHVLRLERRA